MPSTEPRRSAATRIALAAALIALLAGCAAGGREPESDERGLGPAERVAALLEGRYSGTVSGAQGGARVRVDAAVERIAAEGVFVRLDQTRGDEPARSFRLLFQPTRVATRLSGRFAPLDAAGAAIGACPLTVSVRSDGFVASTDAATCRFGQDDGARALVKEIAHDGQRLVIADRIVDVDSGSPVGDDRVLELHRVRTFTGWSGVRDDAASAWRVSQPLQVRSDGSEHRPVDAAGVPLGFLLELAPHRVRPDEPPVLRLRVFDERSGALLAQSWAEPGLGRLGVALPELQVGLRAAAPRGRSR